ncbi:TPA: hypothetical protein J5T96_002115 [Escherichia coli]|nr:hypothetical protein [Escherichia coli]
MAITSAFQADDAGSIPATRSNICNKPYCITALAYFLLRGSGLCLNGILFSGYDLRLGVASVLNFYGSRMMHYRWGFCISWQGR